MWRGFGLLMAGVFLSGCASTGSIRDLFGRDTARPADTLASAEPNLGPGPSAPAQKSPVYKSEAIRSESTSKKSGSDGWDLPAKTEPATEPKSNKTIEAAPSRALPDIGIVKADPIPSLSSPSSSALSAPKEHSLPALPSSTHAISREPLPTANHVSPSPEEVTALSDEGYKSSLSGLDKALAKAAPPESLPSTPLSHVKDTSTKMESPFEVAMASPPVPSMSGSLKSEPISGVASVPSTKPSPNLGSTIKTPSALEDPFAPVSQPSASTNSFGDPTFPPLVASAPPVASQLSYPSPSPQVGGVVRGGQPAPIFAATTLDGHSFDLAGNRGRVVVLDFWFSTCGPCCRAMPTLADLRRKYREDQVLIVGMNNDPTVAAAQRYLRQNSHNWMQIHLPSQRPDPRQTYGVNLFPTFVVIDQVGNMQYKGNSVAQAVQKVSELVSSPSISTLASASGSPSAYLR